MNKRADIPITILVIGVLVICILAIASFSITSKRASENFDEISKMEEILSIKDQFLFYLKVSEGESFQDIVNKMNFDKSVFNIKEEKKGVYTISADFSGGRIEYYFRS